MFSILDIYCNICFPLSFLFSVDIRGINSKNTRFNEIGWQHDNEQSDDAKDEAPDQLQPKSKPLIWPIVVEIHS